MASTCNEQEGTCGPSISEVAILLAVGGLLVFLVFSFLLARLTTVQCFPLNYLRRIPVLNGPSPSAQGDAGIFLSTRPKIRRPPPDIAKLDEAVPSQSYDEWLNRQHALGGGTPLPTQPQPEAQPEAQAQTQTAKDGTLDTTKPVEDLECSICLWALSHETTVRELACLHVFHKICIDRWYLGRHFGCPLCRYVYVDVPDEVDSSAVERQDSAFALEDARVAAAAPAAADGTTTTITTTTTEGQPTESTAAPRTV